MGCRRRKCCRCTECCNGSPPAEWLATFTFPNTGTASCSLCASFLSGEYSLTQDTCDNLCTDDPYYPATTDCCWVYDWTGDETCVIDGQDAHITEVHIKLQIRCKADGSGNEVCFLQFYFLGSYDGDSPGTVRGKLWQWDSPLVTGDKTNAFKCHAVIEEYDARYVGQPFLADLTHILLDICSDTPSVALVPQ